MRAVFLALGLACCGVAEAAREQGGIEDGFHVIESTFARVAQEKSVSRRLLYAIALAESNLDGRPWPWTLNVDGRGLYYASREAAHAALVSYLRHGHRSIDVGLMQVNLVHNGWRFHDTWAALDPKQNIGAAADILRESYSQVGDVPSAVAFYHSTTPWRGRDYFRRVVRNYAALGHSEAN